MYGKKMMKKGGKKFPDLTGDGKVTKADILKGRGVFGMGGKKMMYKEGGDANFAAVAKRAKAAKKPK
tara:strand:- start:1012 stop:1212 length:201 start_codon:yes stop_codon:yes gene_type:complete